MADPSGSPIHIDRRTFLRRLGVAGGTLAISSQLGVDSALAQGEFKLRAPEPTPTVKCVFTSAPGSPETGEQT